MADCPTYVTCDTSALSLEDLIKLLIREDSNGCVAINTIRS